MVEPSKLTSAEAPSESQISATDSTAGPRVLDAGAVLTHVPGARGCCVGSRQGHISSSEGEAEGARSVLASSAASFGDLGQLGELLGIGGSALVTFSSPGCTVVMMFRAEYVIAVELEPSRPLKNIEFALKNTDWDGLSEWALTDRDIEYVAGHQAERPRVTPSRIPPPIPAGSAKGHRSSAPPLDRAGRRAIGEEWAELRRALSKGQLSTARRLGARIQSALSPREGTPGSVDAPQLLQTLVEAIAGILAGDHAAGLKKLEALAQTSQTGPSLKWAAQVWSARASQCYAAGLDAARTYATSALKLAERLDPEAVAVSHLVLAEVASHAGDWARVLEFASRARQMFMGPPAARELRVAKAQQELASCWLLEARAHAACSRRTDSLKAAQSAHDCLPSWAPPVTFMLRLALSAGQTPAGQPFSAELQQAEKALDALLAVSPAPADAERDRRILSGVRTGVLPAAVACQYLELIDGPANPATLQELEELASKFPRVAQFRASLGWMLLRAGKREAAKDVFERLSRRGDLPDDMRASVLLALGCLATAENSEEHPSAKLRAAVEAAPKSSGSVSPPASVPTSKSRQPVAFDYRNHPSVPPSSPAPRANGARQALMGPVFSGNLELFALPELLEFLRAGQRTGTLVCSSGAAIGAIHLRAGRLTGAAAPNTPKLGEQLVKSRVLSAEQLARAKPGQTDVALASNLVQLRLVKPEQVRQALREQINSALLELLAWAEGQFAFNPEPANPGGPPSPTGPLAPTELANQTGSSELEVELDPQLLLLEIFKELDERANRPGSSAP
ncbi:MAG TPA: DUF4388 domain-containing protein [Polyangiaceae bacterium]|nr:DUF4388 domain-containing protein [Polyangiaceae bacterium]